MEQDERAYEREQLVDAMVEAGFPAEFGVVAADELGGPWSMRRMTGYLRNARPHTFEEVADELLAILEERRRIVDAARTEEANANWNDFLNGGR